MIIRVLIYDGRFDQECGHSYTPILTTITTAVQNCGKLNQLPSLPNWTYTKVHKKEEEEEENIPHD